MVEDSVKNVVSKTHMDLVLQDVRRPERILFISDLHFDSYDQKYGTRTVWEYVQNLFIDEIKEQTDDNTIICIVGDMYSDFEKVLTFLDLMEKAKLRGFYVLGNHDYWSHGKHTLHELLDIFDKATIDNEYFRLLMTGRNYHIGDLCIIGDTGWTNFEYNNSRLDIAKLYDIIDVPEQRMIKDFDYSDVFQLHNEWVDYANKMYRENNNVLTLTHFPMIKYIREEPKAKDCWWSSNAKLENTQGWFIHGHTHQEIFKAENHVSHQQGYTIRLLWSQAYSVDLIHEGYPVELGELFIARDVSSTEYTLTTNSYMNDYFANPDFSEMDLVETTRLKSTIKRRGFRRSSANLVNMKALINNPDEYLKRVTFGVQKHISYDYGGYIYTDQIPVSTMNALYAAINTIKQNDISDLRKYMTAVVLTGYAYNNYLHGLSYMRPLDDVDIIRMYFLLLTVKYNNINLDSIHTIRRSPKKTDFVMYGDIPLYKPVANGNYSIPTDIFIDMVKDLPILNEPKPFSLIKLNDIL